MRASLYLPEMPVSLFLPVGLAALCSGLAILLVSELSHRRARGQVLRTLGAMPSGSFVADEVRQPAFSQRVLVPALRQLSRVGYRLSPAGKTDELRRRLDLAGNPPAYDVERVLGLKGLGLVLGALAALVLWPGPLFLAVPLAGAAGFYLPDLLIRNAGDKRQQHIRRTLPDSLDLLTVSVEAGLSFDAALAQVARNTEGPLAGELFRVLQEMQIGKSRADAFRALAARTDIPELSRFVTAMVQADRLGVPIGRVLHEQAAEMRLKRSQRAEEQAHKVPVKILFPMVVFLLPCIFIIIIGPGVITLINTF